MDDADWAAEQSERERAAGIARVQAAVVPKRASRHTCIRCGDAIPEGRRKAAPGCLRCIDCEAARGRRLR